MQLGVETKTIRKAYKLHFLKSDRVETIIETVKPSSRREGELTTNLNNGVGHLSYSGKKR